MRRGVTLAIVGAVGAAALACAGAFDPTGNRRACEAYVTHMNLLERCMGVRYEADNLCEGMERTPVDMTGYFQCLREHSACDGEQPRLEAESCVPPLLVQSG